jgi:tRNA pseudouridine38-40 synthase
LESEQWIADVLAARDRRRAGITAVADGLYFMGASYPEEFGLPDWRDTLAASGFSPL